MEDIYKAVEGIKNNTTVFKRRCDNYGDYYGDSSWDSYMQINALSTRQLKNFVTLGIFKFILEKATMPTPKNCKKDFSSGFSIPKLKFSFGEIYVLNKAEKASYKLQIPKDKIYRSKPIEEFLEELETPDLEIKKLYDNIGIIHNKQKELHGLDRRVSLKPDEFIDLIKKEDLTKLTIEACDGYNHVTIMGEDINDIIIRDIKLREKKLLEKVEPFIEEYCKLNENLCNKIKSYYKTEIIAKTKKLFDSKYTKEALERVVWG